MLHHAHNYKYYMYNAYTPAHDAGCTFALPALPAHDLSDHHRAYASVVDAAGRGESLPEGLVRLVNITDKQFIHKHIFECLGGALQQMTPTTDL